MDADRLGKRKETKRQPRLTWEVVFLVDQQLHPLQSILVNPSHSLLPATLGHVPLQALPTVPKQVFLPPSVGMVVSVFCISSSAVLC